MGRVVIQNQDQKFVTRCSRVKVATLTETKVRTPTSTGHVQPPYIVFSKLEVNATAVDRCEIEFCGEDDDQFDLEHMDYRPFGPSDAEDEDDEIGASESDSSEDEDDDESDSNVSQPPRVTRASARFAQQRKNR